MLSYIRRLADVLSLGRCSLPALASNASRLEPPGESGTGAESPTREDRLGVEVKVITAVVQSTQIRAPSVTNVPVGETDKKTFTGLF